MQTFYEFIWNLFNNKMLFIVGAWAGIPLTLILLIMFARKKNRDERGWKIIGKASIISFIYLILVVNLFAKILGYVVDTHEVHYLFVGNAIQWLYDTVIIVEIAYSGKTAHPFQKNGAPFRLKLSNAQLVN